MASVIRSLTAALAAGSLVLLGACSGGDEIPQAQAQSASPEVVQALSGPATVSTMSFDGQPRERAQALSVPVVKSQPKFVLAEGAVVTEARSQKLATATSDLMSREAQIDMLYNWAEQTYSDIFPSHEVTRLLEAGGVSYQVRHYAALDNYVGVTPDGQVYGYGSFTGYALVSYGHICSFSVMTDSCRPKVVVAEVLPVDGATSVPTAGTKFKVPLTPAVACPNRPLTVSFGLGTGVLTCTTAGDTSTVTITPDAELPSGALITATLAGFTDVTGNVVMEPFTWSFTTVKATPVVKVLTANWNGYDTGAVSVIDPATKVVSRVMLEKVPGYLMSVHIDVDASRKLAYIGAQGTFVLHRVSPVTGQALQPFAIDPTNPTLVHGIRGIAHDATQVCLVTGIPGNQAQYYGRNRVVCFNPVSGTPVFTSPTDFLGGQTLFPQKLLYSPVHKKFYVLMATEAGLYVETIGGGTGRDGFAPGTLGLVVEVDALTYQKGRVWTVGSMPIDGEVQGSVLRVINAGSKSLSKIDLAPGNTSVVTVDWKNSFTGLTNPTGIKIDTEKGVYYVPDWVDSVRVMSLATDQQVGRIIIGDVPWGMGLAAGSLWVAAPKKLIWDPIGDSVYEIDRDKREIKDTLTNVGDMPHGIGIYDTTQ